MREKLLFTVIITDKKIPPMKIGGIPVNLELSQ